MRITLLCLSAAFAAAIAVSVALAGPPMLCHPIEIGDAECLPWGDAPFEKARRFKTSKLVERTIETLDGDSGALVHLETIRRAALYCGGDDELATRLLAALTARALDAEIAGSADAALAVLDAGYLAQCYDQLGIRTRLEVGVADGIIGYGWVRRAIELRPDDAGLEFAAAMITALHGGSAHEQHAARARELAGPDSLVSRNLEVHAKDYWPQHRHARSSSARSRGPGG